MARIDAPELDDYPWFPAVLRDPMTGYLRVATEVIGLAKVAEPLVREAMAVAQTRTIVDLCSGGGGPVLSLARQLASDLSDVSVVLTDKFPNIGAFERPRASYPVWCNFARSRSMPPRSRQSSMVSARSSTRSIICRRTRRERCSPMQQRADSRSSRSSWSSEVFSRSSARSSSACWRSWRSRRPQNFALRYAVPVLPLAIAWEAFASCLRSYSVDELNAIVAPLRREDYTFRVERRRIPLTPTYVTIVIGRPTQSRK